ncbi:MAG: sugar ABC transporter ATP-binding protein [Opitutae bacterium]
MSAAEVSPLLLMRGIHKRFPGVHALKGVDLELRSGECLALLGENGAGKSTLIKMLGGAHQPDEGEIRLHGKSIQIQGPQDALAAGVAVIYQEFNLVPWLSARENIFLGQEPSLIGILPAKKERSRARELFSQLGVDIDPETLCRDLTVAQQQIVEIAKALATNARILVMDEPSAALSQNEIEGLFTVIRGLKEKGIGIIYISHRLDEIDTICDRATVLRDGEYIGTSKVGELSREELIQQMVGRSIEQEFPKERAEIGSTLLLAKNLYRGKKVRDVSIEIKSGEILGLTGLVGSGRTETARILFGADMAESGSVYLDGQPIDLHTPRDAISAGICLLTEDRKSQGLILPQSIRENFGLPNLARYSSRGWINQETERNAFNRHAGKLLIKMTGPEQPASNLSGGNQQKVVLAKWLERDARVLLFDEPTRGIDVGAKYEIYQLLNRLAAQGKGILMISSELPEVLGMSDRVIVMHEGRIKGEITDVGNATQEDILRLAVA